MSAWADTVVTVDFNAQGWDTNTLVTDLKVDGVNLTFDRGEGSTKPTYFTNTSGGAVRLYGGNTMTVSAPQNLKKIDFTFASDDGSNNILSDVGNYNPKWCSRLKATVAIVVSRSWSSLWRMPSP